MSIRVVKLITGEEIVADMTGISTVEEKEKLDSEISFSKPMSLHLVPTEEGISMQLLPWAIYAKDHDNIPIRKEDIMFFVEPAINIRNQYAEMVGLPVIPDNNIITESGIHLA